MIIDRPTRRNPLILSGGSASFYTGMPSEDVAFATSLATGIGTTIMGVMGNYPWVISTQLGTNSYFVINVLKLGEPCGAHATFKVSEWLPLRCQALAPLCCTLAVSNRACAARRAWDARREPDRTQARRASAHWESTTPLCPSARPPARRSGTSRATP